MAPRYFAGQGHHGDIQEGLGQPVTVLLDEHAETIPVARQAVCDALRQ